MIPVLLALLAQAPAAADSAKPDIIYYGGKRVFFYAKREEVVLLDSAWVRYRDMSVYSDSIQYDVKRHLLSAHRDVLFNSGSENITGSALVYDIDSHKGMMRTARTQVENGFFRADEVWLVRERVLDARRATYTTCNHEHPHYVFYGPRVKLLMDDVAISEPVIFKLGSVPVLAAPFWLVPVAAKRKSGLMPFKVGNSSTEGYYSKNMAYYWVINDYSDMTVYADLMTRKGLQTRLEGVYIVNPYAVGSLDGSYIEEWDTGHRRYSLNAVHQSDRFFFGTQFDAKADFVSDRSYVPDYSEERIDWLKQDVLSYAEVSRRFLGRSARFSARTERYVDYVRHNRYFELPTAQFSFGARPLGAGWTVSPGASVSNRLDDYSDSASVDTAHLKTRRGDASLGFSSPSYSLGDLGALTLSEALGLSEFRSYHNEALARRSRTVTGTAQLNTDQRFLGSAYVTEGLSLRQTDNLADSLPVAASYTADVDARVIFYRVFSTEALGMRGLLHSVTPGVGLSYVPEVDTGGLFGRPRFTTPGSGTALRFNLQNGFQAKTDTLGTKLDLGSVNFASAYDLVSHKLSPLTGIAGFRPLQSTNLNLQLDAQAAYDFDSMALRKDYSVNTTLYWNRIGTDSAHGTRGFQLGLTHTLGRDASGNGINMVRATAAAAAFGWRVTLGNFGYNFQKKELADYGFTVWRDLHCWEAIVNVQRLGPKWKYDFEARIKALPDIRFSKSLFQPFLPGASP